MKMKERKGKSHWGTWKATIESNALVKNDYDSKDNYILILIEKKIYGKLVAERNNELNTLSQKTKYD